MAEWLCLIGGTLFLLTGIVIFAIELYGAYHYHYVLNRMHMAAFGDYRWYFITRCGNF